jgi:hypothetical protein
LWSCRSGSGQKIEATKRGDPPANRRSGTNFVINILSSRRAFFARGDEAIEQAHRHAGFWRHFSDMPTAVTMSAPGGKADIPPEGGDFRF